MVIDVHTDSDLLHVLGSGIDAHGFKLYLDGHVHYFGVDRQVCRVARFNRTGYGTAMENDTTFSLVDFCAAREHYKNEQGEYGCDFFIVVGPF